MTRAAAVGPGESLPSQYITKDNFLSFPSPLLPIAPLGVYMYGYICREQVHKEASGQTLVSFLRKMSATLVGVGLLPGWSLTRRQEWFPLAPGTYLSLLPYRWVIGYASAVFGFSSAVGSGAQTLVLMLANYDRYLWSPFQPFLLEFGGQIYLQFFIVKDV